MSRLLLALACAGLAPMTNVQPKGDHMLLVTGTVSACAVRDTSKTKGVTRLKTYLTLAVEKTEPPGVYPAASIKLVGDGEQRVEAGARVEAKTHFDPAHPPIGGAPLPLYELKKL
jgi:hypothetical protein